MLRSSKMDSYGAIQEEIQNGRKSYKKPTIVYHFGGPIGVVLIMLVLPVVILSINQLCNKDNCTVFAFPRFPTTLDAYIDTEAIAIFSGWMIFQAILFSLPFGQIAEGQAIPNGKKLRYRLNGYLAFNLSMGLLAYLYFFDYPLDKVYDKWFALHITSMIFAYLFSAFLYLKSFFVPSSHLSICGNTGNVLYDYFMGRELNPRVGKFDIKVFFELRPGLIGWAAINIAFLAKDFKQYGYINATLFCCCIGQIIYIWDAFYFEEAVLTTMDITTEGLGFMLVYGDLTFVPFVFTMTPRFLLEQHYELPLYLLVPFLLFFGLGYYIFRVANSEKHHFLRNPNYAAEKDLKTIPAKDGKKLLIDGWWGWVRHPNYFGDILTGLSWCTLSGFGHILPFSYSIYHITILTHRSMRDELFCRNEFGGAWQTYCNRVKYRIFKYIY